MRSVKRIIQHTKYCILGLFLVSIPGFIIYTIISDSSSYAVSYSYDQANKIITFCLDEEYTWISCELSDDLVLTPITGNDYSFKVSGKGTTFLIFNYLSQDGLKDRCTFDIVVTTPWFLDITRQDSAGNHISSESFDL